MVSYSHYSSNYYYCYSVLILIVVEDGLVPVLLVLLNILNQVLILIVVEDGLVRNEVKAYKSYYKSS